MSKEKLVISENEEMSNAEGKRVFSFSLPAGHTCPGATICKGYADRKTGKVTVSGKAKFLCFAVTLETRFSAARDSRWKNFELIQKTLKEKGTEGCVDLILHSIPSKAQVIRVHSMGGDFFDQKIDGRGYQYFCAWMEVAHRRSDLTFCSYTRSIHHVATYKGRGNQIPSNYFIAASADGKFDHLISETGLKTTRVVWTEAEAHKTGLPLITEPQNLIGPDHPDQQVRLVHSRQPKALRKAALTRLKN